MYSNSYSHTMVVGVQTVTTTLKDCHFLRKLHTCILYGPIVIVPSTGQTDMDAHVYENTYTRIFMVALFMKTKHAE